jgi:hypothetical protein
LSFLPVSRDSFNVNGVIDSHHDMVFWDYQSFKILYSANQISTSQLDYIAWIENVVQAIQQVKRASDEQGVNLILPAYIVLNVQGSIIQPVSGGQIITVKADTPLWLALLFSQSLGSQIKTWNSLLLSSAIDTFRDVLLQPCSLSYSDFVTNGKINTRLNSLTIARENGNRPMICFDFNQIIHSLSLGAE